MVDSSSSSLISLLYLFRPFYQRPIYLPTNLRTYVEYRKPNSKKLIFSDANEIFVIKQKLTSLIVSFVRFENIDYAICLLYKYNHCNVHYMEYILHGIL